MRFLVAGIEFDAHEVLLLPALKAWLANWISSSWSLHCMQKLPGKTTVPFPSFGKQGDSSCYAESSPSTPREVV